MFIPDPDFFPSRIPDATKKEQKNKLVVLPLLVENYLIFLTGIEKYLSQLTQN
jgi:hypothetical protein